MPIDALGIEGGTDNDVLRGSNGMDTMLDGASIDDLNGEKEADTLNGNGGTQISVMVGWSWTWTWLIEPIAR